MPINEKQITNEMIAKAMTKEEAEAYLAELEDFELDSDVLQKVAGGGIYETVNTIIKEVPNVVKNI